MFIWYLSDTNKTIQNVDIWQVMIPLSLFYIGHLIWTIGSEMISIAFRSYILDELDITYQYKVNCVKTHYTGMAWLSSYIINFIVAIVLYRPKGETDENCFNGQS